MIIFIVCFTLLRPVNQRFQFIDSNRCMTIRQLKWNSSNHLPFILFINMLALIIGDFVNVFFFLNTYCDTRLWVFLDLLYTFAIW
ncbi:MAG: hypothetical protein EXX96DRAFT_565331 [Benjaminiella poitrasii]|nr:MAG: hypothetical protein EXX96DRAFT_565331 [Benjaminiella poitrasii]